MKITSVLSVVVSLLAVGSEGLGEEPRVKVRNHTLAVSFIPEHSQMKATAEIFFEPAEKPPMKLAFFLHGELAVDSIRMGEDALEFAEEKVLYDYNYSLVATRVEVELGGRLGESLTVQYSGYFHPSKARSPSDYMRIDRDAILLRSYGYSLWFPVFLEARQDGYAVSFSKVTIRTPHDFRSVFVGHKIRDYQEGDQRVSEWEAKDVDLFAAQCTAQRYLITEKDGYFIYHFQDQASRETAEQIRVLAQDLNAFYKQHYKGDAETAQVHIMQMPRYGDIASGNVVGMSTEAWQQFDPSSSSARLFAHELVHAFVQPPVERDDPLYALAVEGFPSYFYLPALAEILGEDYYETFIKGRKEQYLQKRQTGTDRRGNKLPPEKPILEITADEIGIYKDEFVLSDRVLLFFDYIRSQMGKDRFLAFAKELFNKDALNAQSFKETILRFLPGANEDLRIWLHTTEYPSRFR